MADEWAEGSKREWSLRPQMSISGEKEGKVEATDGAHHWIILSGTCVLEKNTLLICKLHWRECITGRETRWEAIFHVHSYSKDIYICWAITRFQALPSTWLMFTHFYSYEIRVITIILFYSWRNWGWARFSNMAKGTWLVKDGDGIWICAQIYVLS